MKCVQEKFFDQLAGVWDESRNKDDKKLSQLIEMVGIQLGDQVLDIGCGTGVLVPFLKKAVGDGGGITELDFSSNMIAQAKEKHKHISRISYVVADILKYNPHRTFNRITCLNFYPHVQDKDMFFLRMNALLEQQGSLVVMHDISRATVNNIHGQSAVVTEDRLPPIDDLGKLFVKAGFVVEVALDTEEFYFMRGRKVK
ncbi:MAG: methyltransferase domain-containing protein [Pelosinus sp.]|nr:methyltransferase domain-containing protein [Pelosinus sp.]